jgi:MOSC domain-containing protein YiiM
MPDVGRPPGAGGAGGAGVVAVHRSGDHSFSKPAEPSIRLVAGMGVEGDAHFGARVQHRSRVAADPEQPNLRQVHLLAVELLDDLADAGFHVPPGALGENITTRGLDLIGLPVATVLRLGPDALVALTGLRNPCGQIEGFAPGLLAEVRGRSDDGEVVRRAGVMGVVVRSGVVAPGDEIGVALPPPPHDVLARV